MQKLRNRLDELSKEGPRPLLEWELVELADRARAEAKQWIKSLEMRYDLSDPAAVIQLRFLRRCLFEYLLASGILETEGMLVDREGELVPHQACQLARNAFEQFQKALAALKLDIKPRRPLEPDKKPVEFF